MTKQLSKLTELSHSLDKVYDSHYRQLYKLHDSDPEIGGVFPVSFTEAIAANKQGYGIFHTVNEFDSTVRRLERLKRIRSWYVETDKMPKPKVIELLSRSLIPTRVVESKNGFHIYWDALDASVESYQEILERLILFFGGDKGVKDIARILRVPEFYHLKQPSDPFLIKEVFRSDYVYSEKSMIYFFKAEEKEETNIKQRQIVREALKDHGGMAVWDYFINLDCEAALQRISGSDIVNGEVYSFKPSTKNTKQIYVNGKRSQCWLDADKKIGSHSKGGPGIFNWIKWFGYQNREVVSALGRFFPEGFKK